MSNTTTDAFTTAIETARAAAIAGLAEQVRTWVPTATAVRLNIDGGDEPGLMLAEIDAVRLADGRTLITNGDTPWQDDEPREFTTDDIGVLSLDPGEANEFADEPATAFYDWVDGFRHQTNQWPNTLVDSFTGYTDGDWVDLPDGDATNGGTGPDAGPVERRIVEFGLECLTVDQVASLIDASAVKPDVIDGVYVRNASQSSVLLRVGVELADDFPASGGGVDWVAVTAALAAADLGALAGPVQAAHDGGYDHVLLVIDGPAAPAVRLDSVRFGPVETLACAAVPADTVLSLSAALRNGLAVEVTDGLWVDADDLDAATMWGAGRPQAVILDVHTHTVDPNGLDDPSLRDAVWAAIDAGATMLEVSDLEEPRTGRWVDVRAALGEQDRRMLAERVQRTVTGGVHVDAISPLDGHAVYLTIDGPDITAGMEELAEEGAVVLAAVISRARTAGVSTVRLTDTTSAPRAAGPSEQSSQGNPMAFWRIACRDGLTDGNSLVFWSDDDGWGADDGTWATRYTDAQKAAGDLPMVDGDGLVWWVPDAPQGGQRKRAIRLLVKTFGITRGRAGQLINDGDYDRLENPDAAAELVAERTRAQRAAMRDIF